MRRYIYLRAYMAGVTVPSVLVMLMLTSFVVLRFGYNVSIPIERFLVFPLAIVPCLWGLWNMLYVVVRKHWRIPLGLHGALVPLVAAPLALGNAFLAGFQISRSAWTIFPAGVSLAMLAYYLAWKYLVGFLNGVLDVT
ncbi:MAG TPA: hypothetical protein VKB79_25080 [Bryobacteraceae bacterium]|nr:hypothetical protein [Bryobacteraceae bacterium]